MSRRAVYFFITFWLIGQANLSNVCSSINASEWFKYFDCSTEKVSFAAYGRLRLSSCASAFNRLQSTREKVLPILKKRSQTLGSASSILTNSRELRMFSLKYIIQFPGTENLGVYNEGLQRTRLEYTPRQTKARHKHAHQWN